MSSVLKMLNNQGMIVPDGLSVSRKTQVNEVIWRTRGVEITVRTYITHSLCF